MPKVVITRVPFNQFDQMEIEITEMPDKSISESFTKVSSNEGLIIHSKDMGPIVIGSDVWKSSVIQFIDDDNPKTAEGKFYESVEDINDYVKSKASPYENSTRKGDQNFS